MFTCIFVSDANDQISQKNLNSKVKQWIPPIRLSNKILHREMFLFSVLIFNKNNISNISLSVIRTIFPLCRPTPWAQSPGFILLSEVPPIYSPFWGSPNLFSFLRFPQFILLAEVPPIYSLLNEVPPGFNSNFILCHSSPRFKIWSRLKHKKPPDHGLI